MFIIFTDSVVSVSNMPVMLAQANHISFSSGEALALFQFTYIIPQLFTTVAVEHIAVNWINSETMLCWSLCCSVLSTYCVALSMKWNSILYFYLSRFIQGMGKHEKVLSQLINAELELIGGKSNVCNVKTCVVLGMITGMCLSGLGGDVVNDVTQLAFYFTFVELTVLYASIILSRKLQKKNATEKEVNENSELYANNKTVNVNKPVLTFKPYLLWVKKLFASYVDCFCCNSERECNVEKKIIVQVLTLVGVLLTAGVHQCTYQFKKREFNITYTFIGCHLGFNIIAQNYLTPRYVQFWTSTMKLSAWTLQQICLLLLSSACCVTFWSSMNSTSFYLLSYFLVDMPTSVICSLIGKEVTSSFCKDEDRTYASKLLLHFTLFVKLMSAPARIITLEHLSTEPYVMMVISLITPCIFTALWIAHQIIKLFTKPDLRSKKMAEYDIQKKKIQ